MPNCQAFEIISQLLLKTQIVSCRNPVHKAWEQCLIGKMLMLYNWQMSVTGPCLYDITPVQHEVRIRAMCPEVCSIADQESKVGLQEFVAVIGL